MFTSITLSTGTIIKIPIFDAFSSRDKKTRANGVLRDYGISKNLIYNQITDAEINELHNILTGETFHSGVTVNYDRSRPGVDNDGHFIALLFWYYSSDDNQYHLSMPFRDTSGSTNTELVATCIGNSHLSSLGYNSRFYNSYNAAGVTVDNNDYTDFNAMCIALKASSSTVHSPKINVRSGIIYSIDFFSDPSASSLNNATQNIGLLESSVYTYIHRYEEITSTQVDITEADEEYTDPYGNIISGPGGYDGDISIDPESIDKGTIPELPSLSAVDAGMITMYYCTNAQLQALASYLWTNIYDIETNFVKLFQNPMDCIIGLGIVPVMPSLASAAAVHFGNISTSVYMTKLSSQFVEKDLGSVSIPKWLGCFMDYSPYVKISLYLPYIGYRELSPDDVVGDTIHVVYHIDCLTGGCCAFVETGKKGLLYTFNGSCIANVPLTATNFSSAIQNAVSAVGAGLTTVAGIATGAAPVAAAGLAGGLANAANTAINSKPQVQRSGAMGGAAGLMSYQRPQLIIERPRMCVPNKLNHFVGNTFYVTRKLSKVSGFAQIDMINLDKVPCTADERKELEALLHEGVYF